MKAKDKNNEIVMCPDCKREMTINICETHPKNKDKCHYCHLQKEHIVNYDEHKIVDSSDKTPTKPADVDILKSMSDNISDKMKDDIKKAVADKTPDKDDDKKDPANTYGFSRDEDDDRGLYS